jgi:3-dehydroquinate dehydratase-2
MFGGKEHTMARVLIVHGAGMNMRGKAQLDVFGPMTLPEYNEYIRKYASELGMEVEIFHSNIEGEVINKFYEAHDSGIDAAIINPAGYTTGHPALMTAISQVRFPTIELHISNPARRGRESEIARVSRGVVTGFGVFGYYVALRGIQELLKAR